MAQNAAQHSFAVATGLMDFDLSGTGQAWSGAVRANLASNETDFTWSGAGGVRVDVSSRVSILGEMRVRGIEVDFTGSTAEWVGGVTWRLGT